MAPVLILTYNRLLHLKNLISTLQSCKMANKTDLYIALDSGTSKTEKEITKAIEKMVSSIKGFATVVLWKQKKNVGREQNYLDAVARIFQRSDRLIFLEDDNIVSKNFLLFMNSALNEFLSNAKCYSINGYNFQPGSFSDPPGDIYKAQFFSAWGSGLFRDRFNSFINEMMDEKRKIKINTTCYFLSPLNYLKAKKIDPRLFSMYVEGIESGKVYGDILTRIYILQNNLFSIFPTKTKVINQGFDGSGVHCGNIKNQFHNYFEAEEQDRFCFKPSKAVDHYFKKKNKKWFVEQWPDLSKHKVSLYLRYIFLILTFRTITKPNGR